MDDVEGRVKSVIAAVLKVNESTIKDTDHFVQDLGASSIRSIELVAGFEEEFGIEMDEDEALAVKNVGDAVGYIRKAIGQ
jgi:acyl carrier protein